MSVSFFLKIAALRLLLKISPLAINSQEFLYRTKKSHCVIKMKNANKNYKSKWCMKG